MDKEKIFPKPDSSECPDCFCQPCVMSQENGSRADYDPVQKKLGWDHKVQLSAAGIIKCNR